MSIVGDWPVHPDLDLDAERVVKGLMGSVELGPVRFVLVYPGVGTSRQLYWNDVLTHIRLRRRSGRPLPAYVVDLERPTLIP